MEAHAIAMRKKVLIAEGAAHRARLADAAVQVKTGLQPGELVNAGRRVAGAAVAGALGAGSPLLGIGVQTLMPLLLRGAAKLSKVSVSKPVLRGVAVATAVAGVAVLIFKRKKAVEE